MAREKQLANAPYLRKTTCPQPFADWTTSVHLVTPDANAGRLFGREQSFLRLIVTTGSVRLGTEGTDAIEKHCAKDSRPLADIWQPPSSHRNAPCSVSMDNMAMELCFPMWLASRL